MGQLDFARFDFRIIFDVLSCILTAPIQLDIDSAIYTTITAFTPDMIHLSKVPEIAWSRHVSTFDPSLAAVVVMETWHWSGYTRDYMVNFHTKHLCLFGASSRNRLGVFFPMHRDWQPLIRRSVTVRSWFNTVDFLPNTHTKVSLSSPLRTKYVFFL